VALTPGRTDLAGTEFILPAAIHPQGVALSARVFMPDGSAPNSPGGQFPVAFGYHGSGGLHREPNSPGQNCTTTMESNFTEMTNALVARGFAVVWIDSYYSRDARFCEDNDARFSQFAPSNMDSRLQQVVSRIYDTAFGETAFCTLPRFDCRRMMRIGTSEGATAILAPSHRHIDFTLQKLFDALSDDNKLNVLPNVTYSPLPANRPQPIFSMAISPGCGFFSAIPFATTGTVERIYYPTHHVHIEAGTSDDIPDDCVVRSPSWRGQRQLQAEAIQSREGIPTADYRYHTTTYTSGVHDLWGTRTDALQQKLNDLITTYFPDLPAATARSGTRRTRK
jgi:hypothetical protein